MHHLCCGALLFLGISISLSIRADDGFGIFKTKERSVISKIDSWETFKDPIHPTKVTHSVDSLRALLKYSTRIDESRFELHPGTYLIAKPILIGGRVEIFAKHLGDVKLVGGTANQPLIRFLSEGTGSLESLVLIRGAVGKQKGTTGILIDGANNVRLQNLLISDFDRGIVALGEEHLISSNRIQGATDTGIFAGSLENRATAGYELGCDHASQNIKIVKNTIVQSGTGIQARCAEHTSVFQNELYNLNQYGIWIETSKDFNVGSNWVFQTGLASLYLYANVTDGNVHDNQFHLANLSHLIPSPDCWAPQPAIASAFQNLKGPELLEHLGDAEYSGGPLLLEHKLCEPATATVTLRHHVSKVAITKNLIGKSFGPYDLSLDYMGLLSRMGAQELYSQGARYKLVDQIKIEANTFFGNQSSRVLDRSCSADHQSNKGMAGLCESLKECGLSASCNTKLQNDTCGNSKCEPEFGETPSTCKQDCACIAQFSPKLSNGNLKRGDQCCAGLHPVFKNPYPIGSHRRAPAEEQDTDYQAFTCVP